MTINRQIYLFKFILTLITLDSYRSTVCLFLLPLLRFILLNKFPFSIKGLIPVPQSVSPGISFYDNQSSSSTTTITSTPHNEPRNLQTCNIAHCIQCETVSSCSVCETPFYINSTNHQCLQQLSQNIIISQKLTDIGYHIDLLFDRAIKIPNETNMSDFSSIVRVSISEIASSSFNYTFSLFQPANSLRISISMQVTCKYKELSLEFIDDQFNEANYIDSDSRMLSIQLKPYSYLDAHQEEVSDIVTEFNDGVNIVVISGLVPLTVTHKFLSLLNIVDYTAFMTFMYLVNVRYPKNMLKFRTSLNYFELPFLPNSLQFLSDSDYEQPVFEKFEEMGFDAYFLHNIGSDFTLCLIILIIFLITYLGTFLPYYSIATYARSSLNEGWQYSYIIDLISFFYVNLAFSVLIQFFYYDTSDNTIAWIFNYILHIFAFFLTFAIIIVLFVRLSQLKNIEEESKDKQMISTIIGGLRLFNEDFLASETFSSNPKQTPNQELSIEVKSEPEDKATQQLPIKQVDDKIPKQRLIELDPSQPTRPPAQTSLNNPAEPRKQQWYPKKINTKESNDSKTMNLFDGNELRLLISIKCSKYFNVILLTRKLIFCLAIILLHWFVIAQLIVMIALSLFIAFLVLYIRPYQMQIDNILMGISEILMAVLQIILLFLIQDDPQDDEQERIVLGWVFISVSIVIIVVNAVYIFSLQIYALFVYIKSVFCLKKQKFHRYQIQAIQKIGAVNSPDKSKSINESTEFGAGGDNRAIASVDIVTFEYNVQNQIPVSQQP